MTDYVDVVEPSLSALVKSAEAKFAEGYRFTDAAVAFDFGSYQQVHLIKADGVTAKVDHGDVVSVALVAYEINDLIRQVQDAYLQGFTFLFDSSVPGVYYGVNMVKQDYTEEIEKPSEAPVEVEVEEVKPKATRGRKAKSKEE